MGLFSWIGNLFAGRERASGHSPEMVTVPPPAPAKEDANAEPELLFQQDRRNHERINARPGTRVLIIDDSPTVIAVFRKILRSAGYVVLEALTAELGVEIARNDRPDLIFLDIVLPGMNGFAALRAMRKDPQTWQIPIVMISGNEQATEQFYAERIGADDFMKKPFSRHEVFARIEHLLDAEGRPKSKRSLRPTAVPEVPQAATKA